MTQGKSTALEDRARKWEISKFPDLFRNGIGGNMCNAPGRNYFYFGPSWHIKSGLIDDEIVDNLRYKGKNVLSVGSGSALLERFLTEECGVNTSRVALSDLHVQDLPKGFRKYRFNIEEPWPELGEKFDYILFPESMFLSKYGNTDWQRAISIGEIIIEADKNLQQTGQIRASGLCISREAFERVKRRLKSDCLKLNLEYSNELMIARKESEAQYATTS